MATRSDDVHTYSHPQITVHFRFLEQGQEHAEYLTEPIAISLRSFLMPSPRKLPVGTVLSLRIHVPVEISGSPFRESRHTGHVAAEDMLDDGTLVYLVEF